MCPLCPKGCTDDPVPPFREKLEKVTLNHVKHMIFGLKLEEFNKAKYDLKDGNIMPVPRNMSSTESMFKSCRPKNNVKVELEHSKYVLDFCWLLLHHL